MNTDDRDALIGNVLETVVGLSRDLASVRKSPFGEVRLTGSQIDALFLIAHALQPVTPGILASRLGVSPGAVTQLVDRLRALGMVRQTANPADARSRLLELTPGSRGAVETFEREAIARMRPRFDTLSRDDLQELSDLLDLLEDTP